AGALTSIALDWRMMMRGVADLRRARRGPAVTELISPKLSTGLGLSAIALTVCIAWRIFGVGPVTCLLAVVVSVLLSSACARTTGETDVAPVGPMGGLTQILMGLFAPGQPIATLTAGGIVNGNATQTTQILWALKSANLINGSPRRQVVAQVVGA